MYIVKQVGIHSTYIYGIFDKKKTAIEECKLGKKRDSDSYHGWVVVEIPKNIGAFPEGEVIFEIEGKY